MSELTQISKFLSYILRHEPEVLGLELGPGGWVELEALLEGARRNGRELSREQIERVIEQSDKNRFSIAADGDRIRANYGHSVEVELGRAPCEPPETLCHGTARRSLASIRAEGLRSMGRQWVHLNEDDAEGRQRARQVGARHGSPVLLRVVTSRVDGGFYRSEGGIWLVDSVPPEALERLQEGG